MPEPAAERIGSLDLIRGLAVLGILAINIGGFAGPSLATLSPNLPYPGGAADEMSFTVNFLLFEGKMRALFSMLFGASLLLLIERNDEQGRFGIGVQVRRLSWLALFGLAHFYVLWWGDILFGYAVAGFFALLLSEIAPRRLAIAAVAIFTIWHASGAAVYAPNVMLENAVLAGEATPGQSSDYAKYLQDVRDYGVAETEAMQGSFAAQVVYRFTQLPLQPFTGALEGLGETLPLMMLGMALLGSGFFAGRWRGRTMALMAELDRITVEAGGAVNPYKDARMSAAVFRASFPNWRRVEALRDPAFVSDFWRRTALALQAQDVPIREAAE